MYITPNLPVDRESLIAVDLRDNGVPIEALPYIYGAEALALRPDGTALYMVETGISPQYISHIDIREGVATHTGTSPDDGNTYDMGHQLWMSQDGERIFTPGGNVFRASDDPNLDMIYDGSLRSLFTLAQLTHSQAAGRILAVSEQSYDQPSNYVLIWDDEMLTTVDVTPLPDFIVNGSPFQARPRFVFANAAGTQYYVIAQAAYAELFNGFGLLTKDLTAATASAPTPSPALDFEGPVSPLDFRVVDAEYSAALDRIIAVSEHPNQLHIYDPAAQQDTVVELSRAPTRVSVGPDGLFAAVGHDAQISYVDLQAAQVVTTLDVTAVVHDLVLAGDGWVYVTPDLDDSYVSVYAVEIATGREVRNDDQYYGHTTLRLYPGGNRMYAAQRGSFSSDIVRIGLDQGAITYEHSPSTQEGYRICGNLWLSPDGGRIFTACGHVFETSALADEDISHTGQLPDAPYIRDLTDATTAGLVLAIPYTGNFEAATPTNQLSVWDEPSLTTRAMVSLPDFVVNGQVYTAYGQFVFVNAAGTQYHVIVQAGGGDGLFDGFGLVTGDLASVIAAR